MPSLKAFGRRWHTAADTLPLLGVFLGLYHITWVVAYQLSAVNLDTSGFRSVACGQKAIFATCYIGVFVIFIVAAIAEFSIVGIGLRGGPLEVSKRRAIHPFIHLMPALWLVLLTWTILGTYIVASPNIDAACWEENPCLYEQVADRCISVNGTKPTNISPACQRLFRDFGEATICWAGWLGVGQNWTRLHETCPPFIDPYADSGFEYVFRKYDLDVVTTVPGNLTLLEQVLLLKELNISYDPQAVSESAPWFKCLDARCDPLLRAADDCRQIDILINLMPPQSSSPKHFFEALIYTCWATLAITGIVAYMAFNSFPELDTIESWEGTLKGMARTFCCGSLLEVEAAAGEGGSGPASKEIAKSLLALFGGIDLDPTDRLLGLYLVSEQQSRRRRNHLLRVLSEAGIQEVPNSPGLVRRTLQSITKMSQQRRRGPPPPGSDAAASPQLSIDDTILPANGRAGAAAAAGLHGVPLPAAGMPKLQEQQLPVQQPRGNGFASSDSPAVQQLPQTIEDSFTLRPSPFSQPSLTVPQPQNTLQADVQGQPGSLPISHAAATPATATARPPPYSQGASVTLPPSPYSQAAVMPPSPYSQAATPTSDSPVQRTGSEVRRNWRQMLPVYRQTMLRLRTAAMVELRPTGGTAGGTSRACGTTSRAAGGTGSIANQALGDMTDGSDSGSGASSPTARDISHFSEIGKRLQPKNGGGQQQPHAVETDCLPTLQLLGPLLPSAAPGGSGGTAVGTPTAAGGTEGSTAVSTPTAAGGLGSPSHGRDVGIRVAASYRPMLTPSGCISKLNIAPREAADLCSGYHDPVPKPVMEEADKIRRFAVGAYGLQSLLWAKGRPKPMCFGNMNMLLKCLGRPLRLDSKFRKNNFNAIMKITGALPGDLLYVSYANAPGGVLPYMLMLDRASKCVVLAVRGTVSMQDLVTDLLSTSVDVAGWMPDWVCQANTTGEGMFAHMGIVSSATAILKDLEDNDLLQELCSRVGVSPTKAGLSPRGDPGASHGGWNGGGGGNGNGSGSRMSPAGRPPAGPAGSRAGSGRPPAGPAGGAPSAAGVAGATPSAAGVPGVPPATAARLRQGGLVERLMSWHEAQQSQQLPSMGSMAPARHSQATSEGAGEEQEGDDQGAEVVHGFGQDTRVEVLPQGDAAGRMPDIGAMQPDAEVRLPLSRAKTIIRGKVQEEGWQVVVTGHSLGAAVACLLGFHLREVFPDLRCWCFNPPGGLLSWNLSVLAQRFCTSVVVGKDVISRLSFNTSRRVVDEMVLTLSRCKRPKLLVLADLLLKRWRNPGNTLCALTEISDDAVRVLEGYYRSSFLHASDQTDMYPPGRLLFLRPFKGQKKKKGKLVWDAVWVDAHALMGEGILLAPSMLAHHRLFVLEEALQSVLGDEAEQLATEEKAGVV